MKDYIEYSGEVVVTRRLHDRTLTTKKHNTGTSDLFRIICKALAGYSLGSEAPAYLRLSDISGTSLLTVDSIPLTGVVYYQDTNGRWYTRYNANIEYTLLAGSEPQAAKLQICSGNVEKTVLAEISLSAEDITVSDGVVIIVEWKMFFDNKGVE